MIILAYLLTAHGQATPTLSIDVYQAAMGSTVSVTVKIINAESIAGGSVNVTFNNQIVQVLNVSAGDFGKPLTNINNTAGFIYLAAASTSNIKKSVAILANITFRTVSLGETILKIENGVLSNEVGKLITPNLVHGRIIVVTATTTIITTVTTPSVTSPTTTATMTTTTPVITTVTFTTSPTYYTTYVPQTIYTQPDNRQTQLQFLQYIAAISVSAAIAVVVLGILTRRIRRRKPRIVSTSY